MATYKVLQDIEAEDKLIGPLTPRQCIYGAIAAVNGYLTFLVVSQGAAYLAVVFLPFIAMGLFFAFPWTKQQSTEVWALAKVRFALKPRKRIWDQSGVKELVTVTVPKRPPNPYARSMTQGEVQNRLKALADTIDSRGWATKNVPMNMYAPVDVPASDRLVAPCVIAPQVQGFTTHDADDMFDLQSKPLAQDFDAKIQAATAAHHEQAVQQLVNPQPTPPVTTAPANWYVPQQPATAVTTAPATAAGVPVAMPPSQSPLPVTAPEPAVIRATAPEPAAIQPTTVASTPLSTSEPTFTTVPVAAPSTPEEEAFAKMLKEKREEEERKVRDSYSRLKTLHPIATIEPHYSAGDDSNVAAAEQAINAQLAGGSAAPTAIAVAPAVPVVPAVAVPVLPTAPQPVAAPVTAPPNAAILELANNNDLNVATIAREAKERQEHVNEVVVSLH